ncbi:uncharacterized protein EV154DRAFT_516329 [Mucor mucedo]|uniref:uncharacterized protein n=1 Tax=Mucor mucedo TaxID=29922 RepID=UPI00221E45B7|nr:uncharacterized protein EV154DRAFT_516329 [Mucor mucedo]KAI7888919.1 hypothetical protein EV154DRAFT_516329 [Mucor mucedo]
MVVVSFRSTYLLLPSCTFYIVLLIQQWQPSYHYSEHYLYLFLFGWLLQTPLVFL